MASYKLNLARIRGCPLLENVEKLLAEFGLPENEEYGVLQHAATDTALFATIVRKTNQAVQRLDPETQEVVSAAIEKVTVYPFCIRPESELLEVYAGSAASIDQVATFLASALALPTIVDNIELDVLSAADRLAEMTERFQLRAARISDYAHDSYMSGPYAPKFLDSQHGRDFVEEYIEYVKTANVRFKGPSGNVTVSISPKACFSFSCHEDDKGEILSLLRRLA